MQQEEEEEEGGGVKRRGEEAKERHPQLIQVVEEMKIKAKLDIPTSIILRSTEYIYICQ